jgi:hypothetical protein
MVQLSNDQDWHKIESESRTRLGFRMPTVYQLSDTVSLRPAIDGTNIQTSKHSNIDESWVKLDFYLEFS